MKCSNRWIKVTQLSKVLTMVLLIGLPFVGFYLGKKYQKSITAMNTCPILSESATKCPDSFCRSSVDIKPQISGQYTNDSYSYQLTIPENWIAVKDPYFRIFSPDYVTNGPDIVQGAKMSISVSPEYKTFEQLVDESNSDQLNVPLNPKFITVDGIKAYQYGLGHEGYGTFTVIVNNGLKYQIYISYSFNQKDVTPYIEVYDEMLKSLKFK